MISLESALMKPSNMALRSLRSAVLLVGFLALGQVVWAQAPAGGNPSQTPPESGGPQVDVGPMAIPRKPAPTPTPAPPKPRTEDQPSYSLTVDVPVVNVDVTVTTKSGAFVPGLKGGNFRVYEDGVPQQITSFSQSEAPITAVLLVEFAKTYYRYMQNALIASYTFADSLKKDDWVAVIEFDMRTTILADFTQDKREIYGALNTLRIPGFSETNVHDALIETVDRLERVEGRKIIVLIANGRDTFSKHTFDETMKRLRATKDITIFPVSTGRLFNELIDMRYGSNPEVAIANMDVLQGDNEMRTYANLTGGHWYNPRFESEFPDIFRDIAAQVRNQYTLSYHPTNRKQDGAYRKIKVELIAPGGGPLTIKDEKGKTLKTELRYREGYTAKHQVE